MNIKKRFRTLPSSFLLHHYHHYLLLLLLLLQLLPQTTQLQINGVPDTVSTSSSSSSIVKIVMDGGEKAPPKAALRMICDGEHLHSELPSPSQTDDTSHLDLLGIHKDDILPLQQSSSIPPPYAAGIHQGVSLSDQEPSSLQQHEISPSVLLLLPTDSNNPRRKRSSSLRLLKGNFMQRFQPSHPVDLQQEGGERRQRPSEVPEGAKIDDDREGRDSLVNTTPEEEMGDVFGKGDDDGKGKGGRRSVTAREGEGWMMTNGNGVKDREIMVNRPIHRLPFPPGFPPSSEVIQAKETLHKKMMAEEDKQANEDRNPEVKPSLEQAAGNDVEKEEQEKKWLRAESRGEQEDAVPRPVSKKKQENKEATDSDGLSREGSRREAAWTTVYLQPGLSHRVEGDTLLLSVGHEYDLSSHLVGPHPSLPSVAKGLPSPPVPLTGNFGSSRANPFSQFLSLTPPSGMKHLKAFVVPSAMKSSSPDMSSSLRVSSSSSTSSSFHSSTSNQLSSFPLLSLALDPPPPPVRSNASPLSTHPLARPPPTFTSTSSYPRRPVTPTHNLRKEEQENNDTLAVLSCSNRARTALVYVMKDCGHLPVVSTRPAGSVIICLATPLVSGEAAEQPQHSLRNRVLDLSSRKPHPFLERYLLPQHAYQHSKPQPLSRKPNQQRQPQFSFKAKNLQPLHVAPIHYPERHKTLHSQSSLPQRNQFHQLQLHHHSLRQHPLQHSFSLPPSPAPQQQQLKQQNITAKKQHQEQHHLKWQEDQQPSHFSKRLVSPSSVNSTKTLQMSSMSTADDESQSLSNQESPQPDKEDMYGSLEKSAFDQEGSLTENGTVFGGRNSQTFAEKREMPLQDNNGHIDQAREMSGKSVDIPRESEKRPDESQENSMKTQNASTTTERPLMPESQLMISSGPDAKSVHPESLQRRTDMMTQQRKDGVDDDQQEEKKVVQQKRNLENILPEDMEESKQAKYPSKVQQELRQLDLHQEREKAKGQEEQDSVLLGTGLRRASRDLGLTHYARADSSPQLRYTPIDQNVSPGPPVSLKCSAMGSPFPVITWSHDHRPLHNSLRISVGSFRTAIGEVVSHVNISDVTVRDGGTYICTAHNAIGSVSHSATLNVYGPPFVRAMPNKTSVAGEDVELWCPAGGFPTPSVTWRRDGQVLPASHNQELLSNGTLLLRNAGHEDAGRYSCIVSGRQGQTATSDTYLHVLKPPEIDAFSFGRNLEEGRRTQLSCMVNSGDLPITINWLKDGRYLQRDPDVESKQISDFSTVLLFKSLRERHSGSYTCEAANAAAAVNHTATLRVKVSPRWVVEPISAKALVGSAVVLDCNARGYPQPVLTWMKASGETAQDFQPVVLDGIKSTQAPNGSLILLAASTSDSGWFKCRASNSVGKSISKVIQLIVHAPAHIITEGTRVTGHAGQTVTVTCEATGDEPLTLTWHRHHAPITQTHRISIRDTAVGGLLRKVLEIRGVTSADAGPYTCHASNPHGDRTEIFKIEIIEPPLAPTGVTVDDITSRSVRISWSLHQPATVTIQYRASKDESWSERGRNVTVGQWATSHVLVGLTPYHTYAVRLMAHNDLGVSQPSHVHVFTTLEEAPSGSPRDVRVAPGGPRSLVVTWRAPDPRLTHGPLRGYMLALRRQNLKGHLNFFTRPVTASGGDADAVERYEVRGLLPGSLYEVAVRAFTKAGPGPLSTPRIIDSTGHDAPSCPPAGVSCRGSGRGGVRVWWSPPPTNCAHAPVNGYTIVATPTKHVHPITDSSTWEMNTTNLEKNLDSLPPATNISVRVKAFNDIGFSPSNEPVFCITEDDVPGPPERVRVVVTGPTTVLVSWLPPLPPTGNILHYTLYSARNDKVAVRDVVGAGGSEATWRELTGLEPASKIQVWVTATTVAGEGNASPRLLAHPSATPTHPPVAVGGGRSWRIGVGAGVTLGCRGLGTPPPTTTWTQGSSTITNDQFTQLIPGGDLHLTGVRRTANYTCWVRNSVGVDSLTHHVVAVTIPSAPSLTLTHATQNALNLTVTSAGDGGAPILGYTVHHRGRAGEWIEMGLDPGSESVMVRGLPCGAPHHLYLTAWNSHGTSTPSPVLVARTAGKAPGRPDPARVVEVNSTCVTLRLYAWPEQGCPLTHWKVELGSEGSSVPWRTLHSRVTRDVADLGLCDLVSPGWHLLRITASSTAGDTTVVYRVTTKDQSGGSITAESVQEVLVSTAENREGWLDAHVVAGVVSAILLAVALIICLCVAVRRRKYGGYRQGESLDNKGGGEDDNARNSEITRTHLYSPTPTKKPRGSLASLKTQDETSDPYEICPYATFSSEGTLEYGLSLHAMTPRDCLDLPAAHSDRHPHEAPAYGHAGRQRTHSHYKETEIAYISNRSRGEYASRPKSHPGDQVPPSANATHGTGPAEEQAWVEESRKDTRSRPHRSRSRTRGEVARRDSSTESNDASSPIQQRPHSHYQHPQMQRHQQLPPQHPQSAAVRGGPHPLPPVRHARMQTQSSSSDTSPMTPPRPLHPPSAFSDSRELSEAECDREMVHVEDRLRTRGKSQTSPDGDELKAELTTLLQRYKQQQEQQEVEQHKQKLPKKNYKNPYSINV